MNKYFPSEPFFSPPFLLNSYNFTVDRVFENKSNNKKSHQSICLQKKARIV